jgi:hypothetical protein
MDIVHGLLPDAVAHLRGNEHEQVWVLGDEVTTEVRELVEAGPGVLVKAPKAYWTAIHYLARKEAQKTLRAKSDIAKASSQWTSPKIFLADPLEAQRALVEAASTFGQRYASVTLPSSQRGLSLTKSWRRNCVASGPRWSPSKSRRRFRTIT